MPISRPLSGTATSPETAARLSRAYEETLGALCLVDRNDSITEMARYRAAIQLVNAVRTADQPYLTRLDGGIWHILTSLLLRLGVFHGPDIFQTTGATCPRFGREGRPVHQEAAPGSCRQIRRQGRRTIESLAAHRTSTGTSEDHCRTQLRPIGRGMRSPKPNDAATEVKCDACDGRGYPPAKEVTPGHRIYSGRCKKCGGKGRLTKPSGPEGSAAARAPR